MVVTTEQLLSFLGIDSAEFETYTGGRYCLIQRDPQPNEEDISQSTDIGILIVDLEGDPNSGGPGFGHMPFGHFPFGHSPPGGVLALDFEVYVDSTLILSYVAGVPTWSGGFTGTVEMAASSDPYFFYRITAEQVLPPMFTSEQVVSVQVVINPSAPYFSETYSFTIEDLTPPSIIGAEPLDQHMVRIEFDDQMATSGTGSAARAGAYIVVTLNEDPEPGVDLEVVGVTEVDGSNATQFDIEVNWEQTPGCLYRIEVDPSVTDSSGNQIQ